MSQSVLPNLCIVLHARLAFVVPPDLILMKSAVQVGLDDLRDEAFSYIRSNLTEHNILKEISCSLVSK